MTETRATNLKPSHFCMIIYKSSSAVHLPFRIVNSSGLVLSRLVQSLLSLLPSMPLGFFPIIRIEAYSSVLVLIPFLGRAYPWFQRVYRLRQLRIRQSILWQRRADRQLDSPYWGKGRHTFWGCPFCRQWFSYAFIASNPAAPLSISEV
jgi:hypothetical protein